MCFPTEMLISGMVGGNLMRFSGRARGRLRFSNKRYMMDNLGRDFNCQEMPQRYMFDSSKMQIHENLIEMI